MKSEILRLAEVEDYEAINDAAEQAGEAFDAGKEDIIPAIDAILFTMEDEVLRELRCTISDMDNHMSENKIAEVRAPSGRIFTRDTMAGAGGLSVPLHLRFDKRTLEYLRRDGLAPCRAHGS